MYRAALPRVQRLLLLKARREAEAAHLVVVNHALMLADLASEANVLPPYDHLIVDEAHNIEDVATDQFGFSVDQDKLIQFLDDLFQSGGSNISGGLVADLPKHFRESAATQGDMDKATAVAQAVGPAVTRGRESIYDCFNRLTVFITQEAETSSYDPRLRLTANVRKQPGLGRGRARLGEPEPAPHHDRRWAWQDRGAAWSISRTPSCSNTTRCCCGCSRSGATAPRCASIWAISSWAATRS